jgi:hypothetical protein
VHVTPQTLAQMQTDLPLAARLLAHAFYFDAIGYAAHQVLPLLVKRR